MISRSVGLSIVAVVTSSLLVACAGVKGDPLGGRYHIEKRFERPIDADTLGIHVSSGLTTGSLSDEQLEQLATFLTHLLRDSKQFGAVFNLAGEEQNYSVDMILNVSVTEFRNASEQDRAEGVRSRLVGELSLLDREKNNRGLARVEADGFHLVLVGKIRPPDTVKYFAVAILELLQ
jgi:hypothetical protein